MDEPTRLNKKQKRASDTCLTLSIKPISFLTKNQELVYKQYKSGDNLLLMGTAGTGKSYLALSLALQQVLVGEFKRVVIIRSTVASRDMGFLPGSPEDKGAVFELPYSDICEEITGRKDAYDLLKKSGQIIFRTSSFVRGTTLRDAIVLVDEFQNMTAQELHSIITRLGKGSKVIFSGDIKQNDLVGSRERSGFADFVKILQEMPTFSKIEFTRDDVVRSGLVKEYILVRDELENEGIINSL